MSAFITSNFIPVEAHIKEHPEWFRRFDASWTPIVVILDPDGVERYRIEGYLPKPEFRAELEMGLARVAFKQDDFAKAAKLYADIVERFPQTVPAPEARYWAGVSKYKETHDPSFLKQTGQDLAEKYPKSVWATKSSIWIS